MSDQFQAPEPLPAAGHVNAMRPIPSGHYNVGPDGRITDPGEFQGRFIGTPQPRQELPLHQQVPPVPANIGWGAEHFDRSPYDVKQSRDRAQYVRQQKGHSLILHLLLGGFVLWIPAIYYTASPNHYWHA